MLPVTKRTELTTDLTICPLLSGMWQVSGGHGQIDAEGDHEREEDAHRAGPRFRL